jgi:hypothetical protein
MLERKPARVATVAAANRTIPSAICSASGRDSRSTSYGSSATRCSAMIMSYDRDELFTD